MCNSNTIFKAKLAVVLEVRHESCSSGFMNNAQNCQCIVPTQSFHSNFGGVKRGRPMASPPPPSHSRFKAHVWCVILGAWGPK